jgi:hypothetical protein
MIRATLQPWRTRCVLRLSRRLERQRSSAHCCEHTPSRALRGRQSSPANQPSGPRGGPRSSSQRTLSRMPRRSSRRHRRPNREGLRGVTFVWERVPRGTPRARVSPRECRPSPSAPLPAEHSPHPAREPIPLSYRAHTRGLVSGHPTKDGSMVHRRGTEPTWDHWHGRRSVTSWTTSRHGRPGDPDRTAACGETVMWITRSSRIHAIRPSASSRSSVY